MRKQLLTASLTFLLIFLSSVGIAQVGINTDGGQPDPSAMLDVKSSTKGFLPPRVALTAANVAAPVQSPVATGLLVFNTATSGDLTNRVTPGYYYWGGTRWEAVAMPGGVSNGEMLFWNGSTWVTIPTGIHGEQLYFCNGIPTWGGCYAVVIFTGITGITATTAILGGEVISGGGTPVVSRGFCWSTSPDPTIADNIINAGSGIGPFFATLTGLSPNTTYYIRAFAQNSLGFSYANGPNSIFTTSELTDAPVTFLPELTFCPGGVIDVPVYVSTFNFIGSFSLLLHYSPASLTFNSATNTSGFSGLNVDDSTPGTLVITGAASPAVTFPDSTILCTLHYTYLGGNTDLQWFDNGSSCQYVAGDLTVLYDTPPSSFYLNGSITEENHVEPPVFLAGSTSGRCQGAGTVVYTATSAFSTSVTYSLDQASIAAGNTIVTATGAVTYAAGWSGTSVITALAQGCTGPVSSIHTVTVEPSVAASISIVESANNVCTGTEVTYTATAVNGGTNPVYQWKVNGANAGTNSETFSYIPLNGDAVLCELTSSANCIALNPVPSNSVSMTVRQPDLVTATITPSANSVCAGDPVTFTAAVTFGGTNPVYQWKVNGTDVGTNHFEYTYQPVDGDVVTCRVLSNASCVTGNPAMSNEVVMIVNPVMPVNISIYASVNSICAGTMVTLTAVASNGGTNPSYQWRVNGNPVGGNSNTLTFAPNNGDVVTCTLMSSETCASGNPATSSPITMVVFPNLPVSVTIVASGNQVCAGTSVTYTATAVNGGNAPSYQWKVNGVDAGTNVASFSYVPLNSDVVTCQLTSNVNCAVGNPDTSDAIIMDVDPLVPASVTIAASANPVCAGSMATFTAVPVNGGTAPVYQWKVNGNNVGTNSPEFSYLPVANDQVLCEMTSNIACVAINPVISNMEVMIINPLLPVSASIQASENPVCAGTPVTYTATVVNGGVAPGYQWQVNSSNIGTNSATFVYSPADFDAVSCIVTSSENCTTGNPDMSNVIDMTVDPQVTVNVTVTASANPVCAGTLVSFQATPVNGGFAPIYQWKVNGVNAGSDNPVFTYVPANNDQVTCVLTSDVPCAGNNPATSNTETMTVTPLIPASVTIDASATTVCAGSTVTFTATAVNGGTSPVYQWKVNGSNLGTNSPEFTYMPVDEDVVICELTSNVSCVAGNPVFSNSIAMTVNPLLPVSVSIYTSLTTVCDEIPVFFTATPVNGGTAPVYQWKVNGVDAGTNSATYSYLPANGDIVTCVLTSEENCVSGNPATSNAVPMTVNPLLPVSVSISYAGGPICSGDQVIFTAVPVNGGSAPFFQWYVNDSPQGFNSPAFTYAPVNGDKISCSMISNAPCATGNPAMSNAPVIVVNPLLPVSVTVTPSANPVCDGLPVSFTAVPVNGGSAPVYQWKVNGINSGTNNFVFTYLPVDDDIVTCVLTSDAICTTGNPAVSDPVVMTVHPILPVSITIVASANPVCAGTTVTYSATPVNGGTSPVYQWKVNGVNAGANSPAFAYIPAHADSVTCVLSSPDPCLSGNPATSNEIDMTVNPMISAGITISESANGVCAGSVVTFTATPVNEGDSPVYQWMVNGINAGTNSPVFSYVPANNDLVMCELTSNAGCLTVNPVYSNTIPMLVHPLKPVSVTIEASVNPVCDGIPVTFTATPINGGTAPVYQWFVNGNPVGSDNPVFTYSPANLDVILCVLTSNEICATGNPSNSNSVTMNVLPLLPVGIAIEASEDTVCAGTLVTFNADPENGGSAPVYQWKVNGVNAGTNNPVFSYTPANNDQVTCLLTSNAPCATGNPVLSIAIPITVNPLLPVSVAVTPSANPVCAGTSVTFTAVVVNGGTSPVYQWKVKGEVVAGATNSTYEYVPGVGDYVTCMVTSNATCPSGNPATSVPVNMTVNPVLPVSLSIVASANPVCAGTLVSYTATPVNGGTDPVYQWKVNGIDVSGATGASYAYIPLNNAQVSCVLTSNAPCPTGNPATSNTVIMTVNPMLPVSLSISESANPVCAGTAVTFTAFPVNGGFNPQYQWIVNGIDANGATNVTFTYTPANGAVISCVMISDANCPYGNPATSNTINMTVNPLLPVGVSITSSISPICAGNSVTLTAHPVNGGANPTYQWILNGSAVPGATGSTYTFVPVNGDKVALSMNSSEACAIGNPFITNELLLVVSPQQPVSVTITASANPICVGSQVTFTAIPVNGGTNPVYQWKVYNTPVAGATNVTFTYMPVNNDQVSCQLTSDAACATGNPAQSNTIVETVNPNLPVNVNIVASANPVCAGTSVTYTATPINGGDIPQYQWKVNNISVPGATGSTYTYFPVHNDAVTCVLTSNATCPTGNPATSNVITMTVNPLMPVSVSIAASQNPVCNGTTVTYTATPVNGGLNPGYQWKVNGINVPGATSATYTYLPVHNDLVACVLTSNIGCAINNPFTSNIITMTVNPLLPVSVTIAASENPMCAGTNVVFTATPVNGGTSPVYQWKVNGVNVPGATNGTYNFIPVNSDSVRCILTSNATCPTGNPASSGKITMAVFPILPVSVSVTASSTNVCSGTTVNFTATPVNGGTNPYYQWKVNSMNVPGATNPTYAYVPLNGDAVSCQLTSNAICPSGNPYVSTPVLITVNSLVTVGISISASASPICAGSSATFTATPVNGGATPLYQWRVNGFDVIGATSPTYTYAPVNGDMLSCRLTSSLACTSVNPVYSPPIMINVNPLIPVSVSIVASANPVCSGTLVTYTATPVNGGTNPQYQWKVNGTPVAGATNVAYTYIPLNNDQVSCQLTSNISCPANNFAQSNTIVETVNPNLPVSVNIVASANPVCAGTSVTYTATPVNGGTNPQYQWKVNNISVSGATGSTYAYLPVHNDAVTCVLTSNATCATGNPATSNVITMTVNPLKPVSVTIAASQNPVCNGITVTYTATPVNGGTNPAYQWKVNGNNVSGATNVTYSYLPVHNDFVACVLTSNIGCATDNPATSNVITMTVNPLLPVSVTIAASANPECAGTSVVFTATPVNGGTSPQYQWKVNGTNVSGASSATYSFIPVNSDSVRCILTSDATCPSGSPASSNKIIMGINPILPVSVSIAASANNQCAGTSITFTATPVNGGTNPQYQWRVNTTNIPGATNVTYTYVPLDGDVVRCILTSNAICPSGNPATSNAVTMTVTPNLTVSVSAVASASQVCAGTPVTYTATPTNGGTNPAYQWKVNGTDTPGATNVTFVYAPANPDNVSCRLISSLACTTGDTANSSNVPVTVIDVQPVSVTIVASANPVCAGTSVTFTATPGSGVTGSTYQWVKNGTNVAGATASTYVLATPVNNDIVKCILTSNMTCGTGSPATSNEISVSVLTASAVSATVVPSEYAVMPGTSVTFTVTAVNGGTSPGYQWKLAGNAITGATNATYTYNPADHDKITCTVTSSISGCLSNNPATSNQIAMIVYMTGTACTNVPTVSYGGETYNTVQIGTQCWFRENLKIGTKVAGTVNQTNNSTIEKYCYGNNDENCQLYGGLYQWAEMVQYLNGATNTTNWNPVPTGNIQGICPTGWHIPTNTEWGTLMTYLGGQNLAGGKLKEATTAHFASPNSGASNSHGFTALPGGLRWSSGLFYYITNDANHWTVSTGSNPATDAYYGGATYSTIPALNGMFYKVSGLSVRCLKD